MRITVDQQTVLLEYFKELFLVGDYEALINEAVEQAGADDADLHATIQVYAGKHRDEIDDKIVSVSTDKDQQVADLTAERVVFDQEC